jgi:hypothetical protein
MKEFNNSEY